MSWCTCICTYSSLKRQNLYWVFTWKSDSRRSRYSTDHKQLNIYSRVLAKSSRVRVEYLRARVHCLWAEVAHSLVRMRELQMARAREHCKRKYYMRTYGPCIRAHAYSHSCMHTRMVLALAPVRTCTVLTSAALTSHEHSLHPHKLSWASVKLLVICTVHMHTVFAWSDAAAAICFIAQFCVAFIREWWLIESGVCWYQRTWASSPDHSHVFNVYSTLQTNQRNLIPSLPSRRTKTN